MAKYFHVTTDVETTTVKVPEGWFPTIEKGMLALPNGVTYDASAITSSRFESKRDTPARDILVSHVNDAKSGFYSAMAEFLEFVGSGMSANDPGLFDQFLDVNTGYTLWRTEELRLQKHEENVRKSAEAAKHRKENPTTKPEKKVRAPRKKK